MKKIIFIMITLILFSILYNNMVKHTDEALLQKNISKKIIRFHVIGNSNSTYDQTIKMNIKNSIVTYLEPLLKNTSSLNEARNIINNNLSTINTIAQKQLDKYSISYTTSTSLEHTYFPVKQYGNITLPEGNYESVCIRLGSAKGKNWWCVLYPTLCFVDCTYSILPSESNNKLKKSLTSDEYNYIITNPSTNITYQCSLFNKLKKIFSNVK